MTLGQWILAWLCASVVIGLALGKIMRYFDDAENSEQ